MNVAIISTNKNQYSETFIQNHVKLIPANIHFLFDGYLPKQYSMDKGITSNSFLDFREKKWFNFLKQKSADENLSLAIEEYLIRNKIDVIFAEYGPSGVEMIPFSKKLNIPLVVHFHGYDAYRDDILASYGKEYPELFLTAKSIIAVSRHMCAQLIQLGCSPSKIYHLPCGADLTLFTPAKNAKHEVTFVSCGRFVQKKAPANTIKAFSKVLLNNREVRLVMIGDGELLEECIQLTKKLRIEYAIEFKGKLNQLQVVEIYQGAQIFVQHSITTSQNDSEGTPLTVIESAACGLPVIATRHGGITDVVVENETGFLVNENDLDAMAERMMFLASRRELAISMGANARERIVRLYDIKSYTENIWNILKNAVNE